MGNIVKEIKDSRKILSSEEYKRWLQRKLDEYHIDHDRLLAVVIVIERSLGVEQKRSGSARPEPYYKLYKKDGVTKAWVHAAELVLWLKYNDYRANPFVHAIVTHPIVKRFMANKTRKEQIPLGVLFPSARKNTDRLKDYTRHVRGYFVKH